jgi:hypothetical protein
MINIGTYVRYNGQIGLAIGVNKNNTVAVMFGDNRKYGVSERNLEVLPKCCKLVEYNTNKYLVTPKMNIVSLTTGRICKWHEGSKSRTDILTLAGVVV